MSDLRLQVLASLNAALENGYLEQMREMGEHDLAADMLDCDGDFENYVIAENGAGRDPVEGVLPHVREWLRSQEAAQ